MHIDRNESSFETDGVGVVTVVHSCQGHPWFWPTIVLIGGPATKGPSLRGTQHPADVIQPMVSRASETWKDVNGEMG